MDLFIALVLFFIALLASVILQLPVIWPVFLGVLCFSAVGLHRGFSPRQLLAMIWQGIRRSLIVVRILLLIGAITALWRAGGTIPILVYYSIQALQPQTFLLLAFLSAALVSYMLGSSYGTVGTIGVVMIILAQSGGVSLPVAAGAILSGAYFGDRGAPTSSCANLVANVTGSELYHNVRLMWRDALFPLLICLIIYGALSFRFPLVVTDIAILRDIEASFRLSLWTLLPAAIILILPLFHLSVGRSLLVSGAAAILCACFIQQMPLPVLLRTIALGFSLEGGRFAEIISGGGIVTMLEVCLLVICSSTYSGIFEGTGMLHGFEEKLNALVDRIRIFPAMLLTSLIANIAACNQTLAVMICGQLLRPIYEKRGLSPSRLALDIANSAVTIAGLIPWSVACTVPLSMMDAGADALPFACFLYLVPLCAFFHSLRQERASAQERSASCGTQR